MNLLFADTAHFIALADLHDFLHGRALLFSQSNHRPLLTTSALILELGAHFSRVSRRPHLLQLLRLLHEDHVEIVHVDMLLQRKAIQLFGDRLDKNWSLTDCISFVVMQDRGLYDALTSDEHFEQAGFTALLRTPPPLEN